MEDWAMPEVGEPIMAPIVTSQQREQELDEKYDLIVIRRPSMVKLTQDIDTQSDQRTTELHFLFAIFT